MSDIWQKKRLDEIISLQRGHDLPTQNRIEGNVPIMGSFGITGWHNEYKCKGPGVTIGRSGGSMGIVNFINEDYWPLNTALYITDFKGNDPLFTSLLLGQIDFMQYNSGSAQPSLNRNIIYGLELNLPPLSEQKAIAHILGTLDDKIELNRKMNRTLEAMAQALFKSWFVDFDPVMDNALAAESEIPDELQAMAEKRRLVPDCKKLISTNPELAAKFPSAFEYNETLAKWVPEGWEMKTIDDAATVVGGGTPSTKEETYYTKNGIAWLSPKDLSGYNWKFISRGATDITELGLQKSSAKLMPKGTILFSSRAPIGYIAIAENEICTNQGFKSLIANKGVPNEYFYQFLRSNADKIDSVASGSTFKEVSGSALKGIEILIADKKILNYYSEKLEPINSRALQVQKETETLTQLRDRLLPQLISGKVRVKE